MKRPPSARRSPPKRRGVKKATTISVRSEKQISAMQERYHLQGPILTYRDLRENLNRKLGLALSVGTVWHLAHGWEPKDDTLRIALGFPVMVQVELCPRCHTAHHMKRCPPAPSTTPRKPRVSYKSRADKLRAILFGEME